MTVGELEAMSDGVGPEIMARVVRRPMLALDFISLRPPEMVTYYRDLQAVAWDIISTAMSSRVIV